MIRPNQPEIQYLNDGRERRKVKKVYTVEELGMIQNDFIAISTTLNQALLKKTEFIREVNAQIKAMKDSSKSCLEKLQYGSYEAEGIYLYIDDYDAKIRLYYDEDGNYVDERLLTPSEVMAAENNMFKQKQIK